MAEKQVPMLYQGGFTGTWWCATRWRERPDGGFEALEKYDVSGQIDEILVAFEAAHCADGSLVHDFEGEPACPACGFTGITSPQGGST